MLRIDLNNTLIEAWLNDITQLDYRTKNKSSSQRFPKEVLTFEIKLENETSVSLREAAQFENPDDEFTRYFRGSKQQVNSYDTPEQNSSFKHRNTINNNSFKKGSIINHIEENKRQAQKSSPRKLTVSKK